MIIKKSVILFYFCMTVACVGLGFLPSACAQGDFSGSKVTVVLRFDDYFGDKSPAISKQLIDTCLKNNLPLTIGVVPYSVIGNPVDFDRDKAVPIAANDVSVLKGAVGSGLVEVALHGFTHQPRDGKQHQNSEFAGVDYSTQLAEIGKGKELLQRLLGVEVSTFIPPWNSYDKNTLRAAKILGIKTISAGRYGEAEGSIPLRFLPATCDLAHLKETVQSARRMSSRRPMIVVLFHMYEFVNLHETKDIGDYQGFKELMTWLREQKDVSVMTLGQAARSEGLESRRQMNYRTLFSGLVPNALLDKFFPGINYLYFYVSDVMVAGLWVFYLLSFTVAFLTARAAIFFIRWRIIGNSRFWQLFFKGGALALLFAVVVLFFLYPKIAFGRAIVMALLLGGNVDVWFPLLSLQVKT